MEPTLPDGCLILVDRSRSQRFVGRLFVVSGTEDLSVKRAGKDEKGGWLLLSDHPALAPVPWPDDARTVGEVRWMARSFRC